jgi:hypothetical protein
MALTLVTAQQTIIKRCGKKMTVAGLSTTTATPNEDLADPLASALMDMGYQPQNIGLVTDADLSSVPEDRVAELFHRAELRTLENVAGNLDLVNISVGPRREDLGDLIKQVENAIDRLVTRIARLYGDEALTGGSISLDFQEKGREL